LFVTVLRRVERVANAGDPSEQGAPAQSEENRQPPGDAAQRGSALPTARAEALVDGVAGSIAAVASVAGRRLRKAAALAREEVEDMWAEAQQIREDSRRRSATTSTENRDSTEAGPPAPP
jgi:hypothetical protein